MYFSYSHIFRINSLPSLRAAHYIEGFTAVFCQNCFDFSFSAISFIFHWRFPFFWFISSSIWSYNANSVPRQLQSSWIIQLLKAGANALSVVLGVTFWLDRSRLSIFKKRLQNRPLWSSFSNSLDTWADPQDKFWSISMGKHSFHV